MKVLRSLILASASIAIIVIAPAATHARQQPPAGYTFGQAKAHTHDSFQVEYGRYCGHWLVNDPTNNGGNAFLGNAICQEHWLYGEIWYYFDWSEDVDASLQKQSTWRQTYSSAEAPTNIWITYDATCNLVTVASEQSPWQLTSTTTGYPLVSFPVARSLTETR